MSKNNYLSNELTNWEAHPPETNYLGSSPPQKLNYAIYLDFDNIYGGLLDFLNIKAKDEKPTELQFLVFKEALKCLINSLSIVFPERAKYIKAFAEYENLPHGNRFKPNISAFLYNLGVKPVNPFVAYSTGSGKGKNASDIALSLEVVSDILVKRNPIDLVIIASGDIDLYPLVSWIREYTDKEVFIASFEKRLNSIYKQVIDFKVQEYRIFKAEILGRKTTYSFTDINTSKYFISLDKSALKCLKDISLSIIKNINSIDLEERFLDWFTGNIEKLLLPGEILNEEERKFILEFLKQDFKEIKREQSVKEEKDEPCEKFKKNLIKGLKNWLKSHDKASTGLIIKSWFPNWNIDMSENEANQCLKNILEDIEKIGFKFYGDIQDNLIIGEFRND